MTAFDPNRPAPTAPSAPTSGVNLGKAEPESSAASWSSVPATANPHTQLVPRPAPVAAPAQVVPATPAYQPPQGPPPGMPLGYAPTPAPMGYASSSTTVVVQQSNVEIILAWVFTALTLLYMLPWAIAATRRSTNSVAIAIATFFLAWTGLGWLILLVLSFLGPTVHTVHTATTFAAVPPPPPAGMWAQCPTDPPNVRRWWDGRAWTAHTTVV